MAGGAGSGFNVTYIAVAGTNGPGSTTVVGNPLSGPIGVPQPHNPGASSATGGSMVTVTTYDRMVVMDPASSPRVVDVYVDGSLYRRVRW